MAFMDVNGIRLYYEDHGLGDTAIVFAHGAGGNHLSWWQQVPHFRSKYRCVTFDHRGFGQSVDLPEGPGDRAFPRDLRALLDGLGLERALLVGQSMGGRSVLGFALAWPDRVAGLVMVDTAGTVADKEVRARFDAFHSSRAPRPLEELEAYHPSFGRRRPDLAFLYHSIMAINPPRQLNHPTMYDYEECFIATTERLRTFFVPTLFICGELDGLVPVDILRDSAGLFPNGRFTAVPESGHSLYFEDPASFNRVVSGFFDEILPTQ